MEILCNGVWLGLGNTSFISAIVPIVLGGGLTHFKIWVPAEDSVRDRINLRKQILTEGVTKRLQRVLEKANDAHDVSSLRGAPPQIEDVLGDHTLEVFRCLSVWLHLDLIQDRIRTCYAVLLGTAMLGVLALLIALPWEESRPIIAIASYVAISVQLGVVAYLRRCAKRLEEYEKTT